MKVAVQYGEKVTLPKVPLGEGLVGYAALHREAVLVPDVSKDPRYIKVVDDVRSELAIPMLLKDRCIGVFDLESPELDRFTKRDVEILTLLASQAAVAIENARLYEEVDGERSAARKGTAVREARAGGAPADAAAEAPQRRGRRGVVRLGARARRRLSRLPDARLEHADRRARRRLGQRRAGRALQRVRRRAGPRPHVPAPLPAGAIVAGRRADVDQHHPPRAAARGVLLHAVLRGLRSEAPHGHDRQLRRSVSGARDRRHLQPDRAARRAARDRSSA